MLADEDRRRSLGLGSLGLKILGCAALGIAGFHDELSVGRAESALSRAAIQQGVRNPTHLIVLNKSYVPDSRGSGADLFRINAASETLLHELLHASGRDHARIGEEWNLRREARELAACSRCA